MTFATISTAMGLFDGKSFAGTWHRECLAYGDKLIAIGVPPNACGIHRPMSKAPSSKPAGSSRNVA